MKKGIVICLTCHKIVGDSFPVEHRHQHDDMEIAKKLIDTKRMGFRFFDDTPENRVVIAKQYPRSQK